MYLRNSFSLKSSSWIKEMYPLFVITTLVVIPIICKETKGYMPHNSSGSHGNKQHQNQNQNQNTLLIPGLHEKICNVIPKDLYIETGSSAEIMCLSHCLPGKIFWTLNSRVLDESSSKTINSSHTVLLLEDITNHITTVQCHSSDTLQVLGGTIITTYTKPSKLSCILHYKNQAAEGLPELFTCNWKHQIKSLLKINYTVLCLSCSSPTELCTSHETTCTSSYDDIVNVIPFVGHYNITVRAKSSSWEATSDHYEFAPLKILKIAHPRLNVITVSDSLLVEWNILSRDLRSQHHCQVRYHKGVNRESPEVLSKTLRNWEKELLTIDNVDSCSNYTFAVRCALYEAPWSDWSLEMTVLTQLKKSDFKPHLWRTVAELGRNGVRNVRAMWMEVPSTCQDTFNYTVTQSHYEEHGKYMETLCSDAVCNVPQDAHRIHVRIFRHGSLFVEDSVYVPATGESLPQVTNLCALTHNGTILVSWNAAALPVSGYMIDYTHNGAQYYWKETQYTNVTLFDLLDRTPYNITVTPLFNEKTGHGSQVLQICSRVGEPGNIIINVQAEDKSALVSWIVKSQEACSDIFVNYTIFYRTHKGTLLNFTVGSGQQEILLKDLQPETQYIVYIKAMGLTGSSRSTLQVLFKTKRYDPTLGTVLSVCGSSVLVLSLGLCCATQWKKLREKPVPNPGHSSVASWSTSHEKVTCPLLPFHNPSESFCDRVYTEERQMTNLSPLDPGCSDSPATEQTDEYSDPPIATASGIQYGHPGDPVKTQDPSSLGEITEVLLPEKCLYSPYQKQSPVEAPAQRSGKQKKCVPVKQQEKMMPLTVYVTLDMFHGVRTDEIKTKAL